MPKKKKLKTSKTDNKKERETGTNEVDSLKDFAADWRADCKSVCDINRYALRKDILTDITFHVGEKSVEFHAHRLILALRSPVFEAMFYGALADKEDIITIPDVHPEGFRNLLGFLYFDDISFKNEESAFQTYFAADKYCISYLKYLCEKYLCSCELRPSNVWIHLESSHLLNSQDIKDRCVTFLQHKTEDALQDESFLDVGPKTLETLLCMDSLNISEIKLLLNVVRWAESRSNTAPENSLQSTLLPFLRFIRFRALTASEFIRFLDNPKMKDVLTDQETLDILKHINQPSSCALPEWCCTKIRRSHADQKRCKRGLDDCMSSVKPEVIDKRKLLKRKKTVPYVSNSSSSSIVSSTSSYSTVSSPSTSSYSTVSSPSTSSYSTVSSPSSSSSSIISSTSLSDSDADDDSYSDSY